MKTRSVVRGVCLALFSLFASGAWAAPVITGNPTSLTVSAGATAAFTATASDAPGLQWQRNGVDLAGATGATLTVSNVQSVDTGIYWLKATNGSVAALSQPAMLGLATTSKVIGAGTEVGVNISAPSGVVFDQLLLSGAAAAVTADSGQMTRVTFLDPDGDLVQIELTGAGTLSIALDDVSGPVTPAKYNQNVSYMKGRAGLVITGANETSNLSVYTVGTQTAVNQALFRSEVTYDGVADIGFVAIASADGKFGALNTGNVRYGAPVGLTGVFAPGVEFTGPAYVGDVDAAGSAIPFLALGAATDARVLGGDLLQTNGQPVSISGITNLQFAEGTNTHGVVLPAQTNQAQLVPYAPFGSSTALPAITAISSARQVVNLGQSFTLNVTATGATSYQWRHNGKPISGATTASHTIASAAMRDSGWYQVAVTNGSGTTVSAVMFRLVAPPTTEVVTWGGGFQGPPAVLTGVVAVAAETQSDHVLALKADGTVAEWGGVTDMPAGLTNVVAVANGGAHSLALKADGSVVAWGDNSLGQASVPADLTNVVAIAAGLSHSLALRGDGTVISWGQYHAGSTNFVSIPVPAGVTEVTAIAAGDHSLALKADGTLVEWGSESTRTTTVPVNVTNVVAIAVGSYHSVAAKADGTVAVWGVNAFGVMDIPAGLANVVSVSAGQYFSVALKADGTIAAWGWNDNGQTNLPGGLANVIAVASGGVHSVALRGVSGEPGPTIASFTPTTLGSGMTVVITGTGFSGATAVKFNGVSAGFTVNSNTQITATVPAGATTGAIAITTTAGTATSGTTFTYTTAPIITGMVPTSGPARSIVTVNGFNLGSSTITPAVSFNGLPAPYVPMSWVNNGTYVTMTVPVGATSGLVAVTNSNGTGTSSMPFTVTTGTPPPNDSFGSARDIAGSAGAINGTTLYATKEAGEPAHGGDAGGASVWYSWTAPSSGYFLVSTSGNIFGTLVGIYTGASLPSLTAMVGGADQYASVGAALQATSGTTYLIAIDGYGGINQDFTLTWGALGAPSINGFYPASASSGQTVDIHGSGFTADSVVMFNGAVATSTTRFAGLIIATVPVGVTTGRVTVTTPIGTATSSSEFTAEGPATAPLITTQPVDQVAEVGGSATFSVVASGTPAPTYQWKKDGRAIVGATNAILNLANLQVADAGKYAVTVTNGAGGVTSRVATLSGTQAAPVISTPPQAVTVTAGQAATLTVSASGAAPLAYQWRRNGYAISGATAASHTIASARRSDADVYDVLVYSGLTFTASPRARLSVAPTSYPNAVVFDRSAAMLLEDANGGYVQSIVPLAGGKFLAAGEFASIDGQRRLGIARFNADGTLDPAFTPPEFNDMVYAITVQTDGKILAAGWFSRVGGQARYNLVRLNADGTLDGGFDLNVDNSIVAVVRQADGRIMLGGYFTSVGGQTRNRLARLNADGSLDATFATPTMDGGVNQIAVQADGKIVFSGYFTTIGGTTHNRLARVNADGSLDAAFDPNPNNQVSALAVQTDGRILIGGYFATVGGQSRSGLARLNANGTVDTAFNPGLGSSVQSLAVQGDGKILATGYFSGLGNMVRFDVDGTLDSAFSPNSNNSVNAVALPGDGTILIGGYFSGVAGQPRSRLAKLNADGTLHAAVSPSMRATGYVRALAHAPGGKFYVGGRFTHVNGQPVSSNLIRLNADATVDGSFAPSPNNEVTALAMQGDGQLVLGGQFGSVAGQGRNSLARLNTDGTLDAAFNPNVSYGVNAIALQGDGKIAVAGQFTNVDGQSHTYLARVEADGSVDGGYNPNPVSSDSNNYVYALALQADGKLVVGGRFSSFGGQARSLLARVNEDGTLDGGFAPSFYGYSVFALAARDDGKTLVGGGFFSFNSQSRSYLARLNADGTLDSAYNPSNGINGEVWTFLPQEDGRVLVGGNFSAVANATGTAMIARLGADGTRDTGFVFDSSSADFRPAYALLLTDVGQLWVGGPEAYGYGLARLIPASAPTVTVQPANQTAMAGGSVTFTVTAAGTPAPAYQWNFNGVPIAGATSAALTLTDVQLANAGSYSVTLTNSIGSVTSNSATLSGNNPAPILTTQPVDVAVAAGQPATLTVAASGTGTLTYQWRRNGLPIAGATTSSYTIDAASRTDTDFYDVRVADGLSTTMSQTVRLDVAPSSYPGPMVVDPTWNVVLETPNAAVNKVLPLADGRFLVAGDFIRINGHATGGVARFTAAGAIDTTFVAPALESYAKTLAVQADGKILVGGAFTLKMSGTTLRYLIRLNADGSLDPSFNAGGSGPNSNVQALAVAADGRIHVGGWFSSYNGINFRSLVRLNADGTPDTSYSPSVNNGGVQSLALQADGKLVVGGYFTSIAGTACNRIARLNVDGTIDATFDPGTGFDGDVLALALAADGKIYAGGWFSAYNGASVARYLRLNANGSLDATFVTSNYSGNNIESLFVQPDGKVLIGGWFFTIRGVSRSSLVRVTTDGTLDSTPALSFNSNVLSVAVTADGKVLAGGNFSSVGSTSRQRLMRMAGDGTVDPAVDPTFIQRGNVRSIALVPGGKLAIAGDFTIVNGTGRNNIAQLNADGSLDTSFNPGTGANSNTTQVVRQADGKLVVAGYFGSFDGVNRPGLVRLLADGSVDPAFAPTYSLTGLDAIAATTGGKVVVAGYFSNYSVGSAGTRSYLARFNADGSVDAGWNPQPNSEVLAVAAQPDGKLLIGGYFTTVNGTARNRIARLNADGTLDASFDVGSGANSTVTALATLPGGAAWIGGAFSSYNGTSRYVLARVLATGALDTGFGYAPFNGWSTWPPIVQIVPQNDGKVVVGGSTRALSGAPATESLARLNANGTADTTFGTFGLSGAIRSLAQIDDGRFYLVGDTSLVRTTAASVPAITTQPANVTTSAGGSATFSVTATGLPAPTYQWNLNGAPIAGATGATLSLSNVQLANAGSYAVTITNAFGSVASNAVTLSGSNPAPTITTWPAFVTVTSGQPATLSVTATGTGPLAYRWRKAGAFISGATAASLTIPAATMADAAYYDVVINDGLSLGTSPQGRVTVVPAATSSHYRLDPTFTPLIESEWGSVETVAQAADGGFYAAGSFTTIAGQRRHGVARFNADGTLAAAFAPVVAGNVDALVVQADGKLIVAGGFQYVNGATRNRIARLNADGTLDASFDPGSGFNADVSALALQVDGRIVVGGYFGYFNGVNRPNLARLNSDGTLDATFAPGDGPSDAVSGLALAPGGKIFITGRFTSVSGTTRNSLARLNADGSLDAAFDPGTGPSISNSSGESAVKALLVQPDGKVIVGGFFTAFAGQNCGRIVRLATSGSVDEAFVTGTGFNSDVLGLALQADGKVLVSGYFSSYNGTTRNYAARLNADGSLDATWAPANVPDSGVNALVAQSDGRVLMGGSFKNIGSTGVSGVARLDADGALDAAPAGAIRDRGWIYSVVPLAGGKWMIAGYFNRVNGVTRNHIARLNADGTLDAAFDPGSGFDTNLSSLAVQGDGKIIAGGWFRTYNNVSTVRLARINPDGSRDASFDVGVGAGGSAECLVVQADGRIVAVGSFTAINGVARQRIARLHPSGSVDLSFDSSAGLSGNARALVIQPDGGVVAAGYFSVYAGQARNGIVRLQADGSLDDSFSVGTGFTYWPMTLWLQDDGRLVAGGDIVSYNGTGLPRGLARLNVDGSLDATLNTGTGSDNSYVSTLAAAPAGRLLVGGGFMSFNGTARNHLAVLNADGSLDPDFSSTDLVLDFDYMDGALFADDGRLLVWGVTGARDTTVQVGLVLLRPETIPAPAFSTQPASQSFPVGANVTLTAAATGVGPLTYQWFKNGVAIEGATGVSLSFAPVSLANAGTYTVAVTNGGGTTVSNEAVLTVTPAVAPSITVQPKSQSVSQGSGFALVVDVSGSAPFTYQWSLGGDPINGATAATYAVASTQPSDAGSYTVVVTNAGGHATSSPATITVLAAGFSGTHAVDGPGYVAGGTVTITNTITYTGTLSSLGWSALLPTGWSYASGSGQEGDVKPRAGTTDLGEWAWTTVPASPVTFRYTLNVPAGTTGAQTVRALMLLRQSGNPYTVLAKPDPLVIDKITFHAADTNKDGKLGLTELLRVIELFNARHDTVRTGAYAVDANNTEDGFNPDPARSGTAVVSLAKYHTADTNHDGKVSLIELLRVIELYNHRNGTVRTGEYHAQAGTEDGFGVGP